MPGCKKLPYEGVLEAYLYDHFHPVMLKTKQNLGPQQRLGPRDPLLVFILTFVSSNYSEGFISCCPINSLNLGKHDQGFHPPDSWWCYLGTLVFNPLNVSFIH